MGDTYSQEILHLTDKGANRIVEEVLSQSGLSIEEQIRRAALLGFIAGGGSDAIVNEPDSEDDVIVGLAYPEYSDDLDEENLEVETEGAN
ncbi:MAG TPA: hypothetical protein PKD20_02660 [Candidatus Saccharibacteria bacterium]|jgi:hypothetical protein|nr:hypothetical protein [Candidatus Saccharibacteria bacterium]HMT55754.1 hypothetical protein [Candidatus Saccharibacteria bacterium]